MGHREGQCIFGSPLCSPAEYPTMVVWPQAPYRTVDGDAASSPFWQVFSPSSFCMHGGHLVARGADWPGKFLFPEDSISGTNFDVEWPQDHLLITVTVLGPTSSYIRCWQVSWSTQFQHFPGRSLYTVLSLPSVSKSSSKTGFWRMWPQLV